MMESEAAGVPAEEPLLITDDLLDTSVSEKRFDFERGISHWPAVSLLLIAVNIGVFVWEVMSGAFVSAQALIAAGALHRPEVVRGEYWRLFSTMFLHADANHLFGNCAALYILGMASERAFGHARSLAIYLLSGLAGSLLSVLIEPGPTVGASGAIFGLMGGTAAFLHRHRKEFFLRDGRIAIVLLVWAVWSLATGWFNPQIANMAHLGGFVAGSALALVVPSPLLQAVRRGQAANR